MLNFEYQNQTKLYFGSDMDDRLGELVRPIADNILVCHGGSGTAGIIALENFFKRLGVPTVLEEIGVTDDSKFEEMADKYLSIGPYGDIKKLTKEDFINILKLARKKG